MSNPSRILYTKPSISALEAEYARDAVLNGWGEQCYAYIRKFEELFCRHLGVAHAVATSSGTGALHLGMAALGIGEGDEVILADTNWIASVAPVVHLGATPVFVDILERTLCLDPTKVEEAITPRTRAIIAVHLYGNLCDLRALRQIAERHSVHLIEDAAEAIGSTWHGSRAGSLGTFGAFSFHGTKTITTGEGGIFVTNDQALYERVVTLSNHGRASNENRQFWPERIGFKYKMSNVQAAIGCAQIERIEDLIAGKRRIFEKYRASLAKLPVQLNPEPPGTTNGYWMPTLVVDKGVGVGREQLIAALKADNIDGRVVFWPLSSLPMFGGAPANKMSESIAGRAINLPSYHDLTDEEINRVSTAVIRAFEGGGR